MKTEEAQLLFMKRCFLRQEGDYEGADKKRDKLAKAGYTIEDSEDESVLFEGIFPMMIYDNEQEVL